MSTFNDRDSLMIESGIDLDDYVSYMDDNSDFSEIDLRIDALKRLVTLTLSEENELHYLVSILKGLKNES